MYENFYGLNAKPFSILPDPEFLYLGKKHRVALTLLEYALMNNAGFCVITGEIGAGKTTLLRKLLSSMEDSITVGMITNTHQSFGELLDWVLSAFGIHQSGLSKVEMHQRFVDFLLEQYAANKTTLLIVDEAQNMPAATLEELRMLSNINSEKDLVLQVILAGQPDLKDTLRKPELMQFAQRISVDFHLDALNSVETCHYIQHRLVTAGATDDIFTPDACRLIGEYSGGVPRLINLLCDTALVYGFADQRKTIDVDLIEEIVRERMEHSILPLVKLDKREGRNHTPGMDNDSFPYINKERGNKAQEPAVATKNVRQDASEPPDQTPAVEKHDDRSSGQAAARKADVPDVVAAGADKGRAKKRAGVSAVAAGAAVPGKNGKKKKPSARKSRRAAASRGKAKAVSANAHKPAKAAAAPVDDKADKSQFGNRMMLFALFVLALFLSLVTVSFDFEVALPGMPESRQVDSAEQEPGAMLSAAGLSQAARDATEETPAQELAMQGPEDKSLRENSD